MSKKMNWYFVIGGIAVVLIVAVSAIILFTFKSELAGLVLPKQSAMSADTVAHCECVGFVTNKLLGWGKRVDSTAGSKNGSWLNASYLADPAYWSNATKEYKIGSYQQVPNPITAQPGDVIIMEPKAVVYVQMAGGTWDNPTNIGGGVGHIGFVVSGFYYNQNFEMATAKGKLSNLSGWKITMQSANWGYGNYYSSDHCNNVNDSVIFLPTGNPVSFWRLKK
ncbi:MAG: hypothetical protein WCK35_22775 [Chloroflexota bacterium]